MAMPALIEYREETHDGTLYPGWIFLGAQVRGFSVSLRSVAPSLQIAPNDATRSRKPWLPRCLSLSCHHHSLRRVRTKPQISHRK